MSEQQNDADQKALARFGYAQQLMRSMGGFQSFALSFSIISILTGAVSQYGLGLTYGGPLVMTLGWPMVSLFTLFVAASLGQLASSFPTAGALYHWAALLGGPGAGFLTAWLNTVGQFAITAGIDFGLAEFLVPLLGLPDSRGSIIGVYAVVLLSHGALNHVGVKVVAALNTVSAWYHVVGVAILIAAVLILAPRQPASFLLARYSISNHGLMYGFLVALLQAGWTFTGYDASAHATEETVDPTRNAPKGIMMSVIVSAVVGWAMLLVVTLAIPDLAATAGAKNPFIYILVTQLGSVGQALLWMIAGAMWFCGLASVTSNSRMLFAFARDGGLPFSKHLAKVSAKWSSPHVAVWVSCAMAFVVAAWASALSVMTALSVIALYASYALPVYFGWRARRQKRWVDFGPWDLGRWSSVVNLVALVWVAAMTVFMVLPPNELAGYTLAGFLVVLAIAWFGFMRTRFRGPRVMPL